MRNAVQTQLDGVQKGLVTLQDLEKIVHEVRASMNDVEHLYQDCAELSDVVKPIRDVNRKHQQASPLYCYYHHGEVDCYHGEVLPW